MRPLRARLSTLLVLGFLALFTVLTSLQAQTPAGSSAPSIDSRQVYQVCAGQWAGTLEYRDFQSDKHVSLPTNLEAGIAPDGKSLRLTYIYDDGPGKIVRESSSPVVDPEKRIVTITSDRTKPGEQLTISNIDEISRTKRLTLILTGAGEDNNKRVDVRSTLSCGPNSLSWLRETRAAGQDFAFRDKYSFTRWPIQAH
jgi:hypothetical protein